MRIPTATLLFLAATGLVRASETAPGSPAADGAGLDGRAGQPVDIGPWSYGWRADREVQAAPEACFIPRRLERIDRVYRTARQALPESQLKSIHYQMPDLLQPLPPRPRGQLLAGLLWTGGLADCRIELQWPGDAPLPPVDSVEVRVYPTSYGWFGWTVDRPLGKPEIAADGRSWAYRLEPGATMDFAYNARVKAATEMVAVFCEAAPRPPVPALRVTSPEVGTWKRMDVALEWGYEDGTGGSVFDGTLECHVGTIGTITPLPGDAGTTITGHGRWQSRGGDGATRRGILIPLLYAPDARAALDTRVTVWTRTTGFTFRPRDLAQGPILIPEHGVFVSRADSGQTARRFGRELAARNLQSIRRQTAEHREAASLDEVLREVRLWTCPDPATAPPFPKVEDPPMRVELSDSRWTDAWRSASFQLRGRHMWGGLAFEVGRVAHDMDLVGLHDEAEKVYQHFLKSPGVKPDGDYRDGDGALEWATSMRHDMGYSHDGTHASTGRLLFAMAERYFLTGDRAWFESNRPRLQAAADWIIRQRTEYLREVPNRRELLAAGLMPPCMLGDYAIPSCDWHWYYCDNALALQGLRRFAEAMAAVDPDAGRQYRAEADAFERDLRRVIDRETALSPVRPGRDGMYHSFLPRMVYARGQTGPELGAPQFPDCDRWMGALPLAEPLGAIRASDPRMRATLDIMEEMGTSAAAVQEREQARRQKGLLAGDAWFWHGYVSLPKASHNANIYLLQDDVPGFLRFWANAYAAMVGSDGRLWEHWHLGQYTPCENPDNGTAGWFLENFRNLLVMEDGDALWLARATPRAWLEQDRRMTVDRAPTHFGPLAFEIVSDVDQGRITAVIQVPRRTPAARVLVRLRHPRGALMRAVTVNGRPWTRFDAAREFVELAGLSGRVDLAAEYPPSAGKAR